ncbi:MAG: hypothetical protein EA411_13120 [Saprospirales bacterium]|nr:MAG: hypothetical protein EA411_13120 [Saprospirales bacterium]
MWKLLVLSLAVMFFIGCQSEGGEGQDPVQDAPQQMEQPQQPEQQPQQPDQPPQQDRPAEVNIPAGEDGVVHHYICADQCEGGHSETPGMCPVCNQQLAHNRAWHEQPQQQQQQQQMQQQQGQQQDPRQGVDPMRGGDQQPPAQQQQQQPQQQMQQVNIPAGDDGVVHHYICTNRCDGGHSEAPGVCPVCSEQLAHNQAWHDQ